MRRPDIAAAERTLVKDNAIIGIGYDAFFPNVTLTADGGFESSTFEHLLQWPSRFWSIGPSISQTIFDGGLRRAELHQYTATYNADVATYRQTVLTAFQQVEDYLAAVRTYSQQILHEQEALKSAEEYLNLAMGRYETGMDPYLNVLTAQTTVLSDEHPGGIANSANGLDSEPARGAGRWMGPLATSHAVARNTQIPGFRLQIAALV